VLIAQTARFFFSIAAHKDWAAFFVKLEKQVCTFVWCVKVSCRLCSFGNLYKASLRRQWVQLQYSKGIY